MEELIPILVWGILIFFFSSSGKKKKQARAQQARDARLEARRQRMAHDAAAGVAVAEEVDDRAREHAWGTREPNAEDPTVPPSAPVRPTTVPAEPQVPRDVWELVEALARGRLPIPPEPTAELPTVVAEEPAPDPRYARRAEREIPATADVAPRTQRPPPARRSIQARGQARSDAGISGVDAAEHAAEADPTLTDVDLEQHSKVAAAVARARARRNAGKVRDRQSLFGGSGKNGVRRAIVLSEVLGQPTALRDGLGPHQPPE